MKGDPLTMLNAIAQLIYDKKGFNTIALDVKGLSSITDFLLIAEGNVDRHVMAMARAIIEEFSAKGEKPLHTEGLKSGDWVVLDYGPVMIHLFSPGWRDRYSLERLWQESKIVDLTIDVSRHAVDSREQ